MTDDRPEPDDDRHPAAAEAVTLEGEFPVSYSIFAMARVHRALAASKLSELGLFPNQDIMLVQLGASDGLSQKTLAATLRVSHVTVAKTVARMERAGLVERRTSERDRRISLVYLTAAGRALHEKIVALWSELEVAATRLLSPDDERAFIELASRIRPALDAVASPTDVQPARS